MKKLFKHVVPPLLVALLACSCNSGTGSTSAKPASTWQNEVTISHSSSFPYTRQGINSYWVNISNQTANSLHLAKVSLIETSLGGIDINQVIDSSGCTTLASGADCRLKITLPNDLAISGTPLIYFSLNYIDHKSGKSYIVKKALTLYAATDSESSGFTYTTDYLNQKIVDTAKTYSISLPFKLNESYQSVALNVTGAKALSQKIICSEGTSYQQGDSCSALIKLDRKETSPQINISGINREGVSKNLTLGLNITPNVVANLIYLNAPVLLNPANPTQTVTILNDGADTAKEVNFAFNNPEGVGVNVSTSDCNTTTLGAGETCHLTYDLDMSKYLSGAPQEQISYTNGTNVAGKSVDSYYVYTIPPAKSSIKITTDTGAYDIGNLLPAQTFTITATLSDAVTMDQTVSIDNLADLQAAGMVISPTTCLLNAGTTSCSFYVLASNIALANNYTLNLVNSGNLTIDHPNIKYNIVPAEASGSTIHLPQTGQTTSVHFYDDASYLMGVPWAKSATGTTIPATRFTVGTGAETDCVTDNLTGLMWVKDPSKVKVKDAADGSATSWQNALDSVAAANSAGGYCGHTDWHLPTINELNSLVNNNESNPAQWLNTQGFSNVLQNKYLSSTIAPFRGDGGRTKYPLWISLNEGFLNNGGGNAFMLPVRLAE